MTRRLEIGGNVAYVVCGMLCLFAGTVVALGGMFSSYAFGFGIAVLIDCPIAVGLLGSASTRRIFPLSMLFGCAIALLYMSRDEYFRIRGGDPPLIFHGVWIIFSVTVITIAVAKLREHPIDTPESSSWL